MAEPLVMLSRARTALLVSCPFISVLALHLRPRLARKEDGVMTAAVAEDGTLVVCESYFRALSPAERAGLLAHEVAHLALHHFRRRGDRDPVGFNIACDVVVNLLLTELSDSVGRIKLPEGALIEPALAGLTAEGVYERLRSRPSLPPSAPDGDLRADLAETEDGMAAARGDQAAARRLSAHWRRALTEAAQAHAASGRGDLPAGLRRIIDDTLGPARLDWRDQLRNCVADAVRPVELTYLRPSRRSESAGCPLPGARPDRDQFEVAVLLDTSGSIGEVRLRGALAEIDSICSELSISTRALIFDAVVQAEVQDLEEARELLPRLKGGGGSDARPAFRWLEAADFTGLAIVFTDGDLHVDADAPEWLRGVVWVLEEGDRGPPASWGDVIRLPHGGPA